MKIGSFISRFKAIIFAIVLGNHVSRETRPIKTSQLPDLQQRDQHDEPKVAVDRLELLCDGEAVLATVEINILPVEGHHTAGFERSSIS